MWTHLESKTWNQNIQYQSEKGIRPVLIQVWWAVFHTLLGGDPKLWITGVRYMRKKQRRWENVRVEKRDPEKLAQHIAALKEHGKWIIIMNHHSGNFADYLPVFGFLGDDILEETTFFTGGYNLPMNTKEFPQYQFQRWDPLGWVEAKDFLKKIWWITVEKERDGGYIFLIPAWAGRDDGTKPFGAAFHHIIRDLSWDTPILAFHVEHDQEVGYGKILLSRLGLGSYTSRIQSALSTVSDWRSIPKEHRREYYNSLFKK